MCVCVCVCARARGLAEGHPDCQVAEKDININGEIQFRNLPHKAR